MSTLSLNWKALSLKISLKLDKEKVSKPKRGSQRPKKSPLKLKDETAIATTKLLSPLEYALWISERGDKLQIKPQSAKISVLYDDHRKKSPGKYIAMDCEFVGVGVDNRSALARVSIVNFYGVIILDEFVKPSERVTDWRTWVSGVSPKDMNKAISFEEAQKRVADLLKDRILVGHAIHNDLKALGLSHARSATRDTARFSVFRKQAKTKFPALLKLTSQYLNLQIHSGQHSSVEDAQVTMALFRSFMPAMEKECL